MTVLILGPEGDAHAAAVHQALSARGADPEYLDFRRFLAGSTLAWEPLSGRGELTLPAGRRVDLAAIASVFWRTADAPRAPAGLRADLHGFAAREARRTLDGLLGGLSCPIVNPPAAVAAHRLKPLQSAAVSRLGVAVPATVITNDPLAVARAFAEHPAGLVVKPVGGGAYARRVVPRDLQRHDSIRACPMQYQALVPGADLRVYVVGERVLSGRIVRGASTAVDFRADPDHRSSAEPLGAAEEATCRGIARALGLRWTGIDLRRTPAGELVFLEANPSPMFLRFQADTGLPILEALTDLLLTGAA